MSLFGNKGNSNTAPKSHSLAGSNTTGVASFGNATVGAFMPNRSVGVFPVSATQVKANTNLQAAGWVQVIHGTGPVSGANVVVGGTGYKNTDTYSISATGTGVVNATGNLVTNSTGGITGFAPTNPGKGLTPAATLTITTANGTGANVVPLLGGRGNRVQYEVLVASGSMVANSTYTPPLT